MVEQPIRNRQVAGSSPALGSRIPRKTEYLLMSLHPRRVVHCTGFGHGRSQIIEQNFRVVVEAQPQARCCGAESLGSLIVNPKPEQVLRQSAAEACQPRRSPSRITSDRRSVRTAQSA